HLPHRRGHQRCLELAAAGGRPQAALEISPRHRAVDIGRWTMTLPSSPGKGGAAPVAEQPLLRVRDLVVDVRTPSGRLPVLRGVDFSLHAGETLTLLGES